MPMKTFTFYIVALTFLFAVPTQAQHLSAKTERGVSFSTDIVVHNKSSENQRNLRTATAFNGWLYLSYTINDTNSQRGGIYVAFSKDNGLTWNKFVTYVFNNSFYALTDIAVAGTDTANLSVFLAGVFKNTSTQNYTLYMDKFDGRNGSLSQGQIFVRSLGTQSVTDLSIASDYQYPMAGAAPYSVGLLYTIHGGLKDSLLFAASMDGGSTFAIRQTLSATDGAFRKVSLAYGRSAAYSGSYFAAWEMLTSAANKLGHIFTSHGSVQSNSGWLKPLCLDSLSPATLNLSRRPYIACQRNNTSNDSTNLTCVVTFEKAVGGTSSNMNVAGYFNKRASAGTWWSPFSLGTVTENELQPNIAFNAIENAFLLTYYDSTSGQLPFCSKNFNMASPNSWNQISPQFNDQTVNLKAANPKILLNTVTNTAGFAWVSENSSNGNGIILFDSESAGIATEITQNSADGNTISTAYPNPATDHMLIPVTLEREGLVKTSVYDILGKEMGGIQITEHPGGTENVRVALNNYPNGVYFCHIETGKMVRTFRFVLSR